MQNSDSSRTSGQVAQVLGNQDDEKEANALALWYLGPGDYEDDNDDEKEGFLGGADGAVGSADAPIGNCTRVVLVLILLVLVGKAAAAILAPAPALEGYQFGREATACADGTVPLQPDQCEGAAAELGYAWGGKIVDSQAPDGCYVQWSPSHPRGAFYWTSNTNRNKLPDTHLICGKRKTTTPARASVWASTRRPTQALALDGYEFPGAATECALGTVTLQPDQCEVAAAELGYVWGGKIVYPLAPDGCYVQWSPSPHQDGTVYWTSTTNHNTLPDTCLICGKTTDNDEDEQGPAGAMTKMKKKEPKAPR